MGSEPEHEQRASALDGLAGDLQRRRVEAGAPSYAEIARRVDGLRRARGVPPSEARPARTTVYDVFRLGRRRVDVDLVLDVVRALGGDEEEVARWAGRHHAARLETTTPVVEAAEPAEPVEPVEVHVEEPVDPVDPVDPVEPLEPGGPAGRRRLVAVLAACVALNLLGRVLVDSLGLPLYLDMTGTAVSAVLLGPWWGVLVGVATNVLGVPLSGLESAYFVPVNIVGALVWGYGVRRGAGPTIVRLFAVSLVVAVASTVVAAPVIVALGGHVGHGTDDVISTIQDAGRSLVVAVLSANLVSSIADKLISGFLALAAWDAGAARRPGPAPAPPTTAATRDPDDAL